MDGNDDFADWPSSFRDARGGREDRRGYGSADRNDYEDELRVPAQRSGEARYASLADLSGGPEPAGRAGEPVAERPRGRDRGEPRAESRAEPRGESRSERRAERYPSPAAYDTPYDNGYDEGAAGGGGGVVARRGGGGRVDPDFAPRGSRSVEQLPPPMEPMQMPMPMPMPVHQPPPPPPQPAPESIRQRTETIDPAAVRRSVAESDGVYRSKKPGMAVLFGAVAGLGELLMLRPLLAGLFKTAAGPALAPLLAMVAFPMLALGLYALTTGAATAVQFQGPRVWLRTPLVYLIVGLSLMMAAAAAA